MKFILLIHVFATLFMTGLIWFVQIVHYPLFANVGSEEFRTYEERHQRLTTWIVGPAMLVELATALLLLKYLPSECGTLAWIGAALVAVLWLSTATLSVPAHNALTVKYSTVTYNKLVATNWIRTITWTVRAILVLVITYRTMN
ncbi:MAG: hypothetical protein MK102_13835 [Fuerstiella sp.]|nr:hypothetical protein [Fuerstiella sp.]